MSGSFFFHRGSSASRLANSTGPLRLVQLTSSAGDGFDAEPGDERDEPITAVAELFRFESCIEPALTFIEDADKDVHVLVQDFGWAVGCC